MNQDDKKANVAYMVTEPRRRFYMNMAKMEEPITVITPHTTMERLLIAPSMVPISIALAVPSAWAEQPMAIPLAIGSWMRNSLRNFSAKILPSTPVTMMTTTETET